MGQVLLTIHLARRQFDAMRTASTPHFGSVLPRNDIDTSGELQSVGQFADVVIAKHFNFTAVFGEQPTELRQA